MNNQAAIHDLVRRDAMAFMSRCHFGLQGIARTEREEIDAINRLIASGYHTVAFDTEMVYVPLALSMLSGITAVHAAVSYPLGRMTTKKKLQDLETLARLGVTDACVCLDYAAIFSRRYADVEAEARVLMDSFRDTFTKTAFAIPATLMSDREIVDTCKALDQAGVVSVKVNPGVKLNVSYEEVALIQRVFPGRFDVHPAGGIRHLDEVERFMQLGCEIIHSAASLDIVEEFIAKKAKEYGGESHDC